MRDPCRRLLSIFFLQVIIHVAQVRPEFSTIREHEGNSPLYDCPLCLDRQDLSNTSSTAHPDEKDIDIIVTYSDPTGAVRIMSVRSRDLSSSWVWKNPSNENYSLTKSSQVVEDSFRPTLNSRDPGRHTTNDHQHGSETRHPRASAMHPLKLKRRILRRERRERRTAELIQQDKEIDNQMQEAAIKRSMELDTTIKGKYSIWRKEYENPNSDSTVKLMRDQIIMARVYATIAKAKNNNSLYGSLMEHSRESQLAIGEATFDSELHPRS